MTNSSIASVLILSLLHAVAPVQGALSQTQGQKKAPETTKAKGQESDSKQSDERSATRSRAATVLRELNDEIYNIDNRPLKLLFKAKIGDAMWDYDEVPGKRLIRDAVSDMVSLLTSPSERASRDISLAAAEVSTTSTMVQFVSVVARRDPRLAKDLANAAFSLSQSGVREKPGSPEAVARAQQQTMLGMGLLDTDLGLSTEVAASAIDAQVDSAFIAYLGRLREKDQAAAFRLFSKALTTAMRSPDWFRSVEALAIFAIAEYGVPSMRSNLGLWGRAGDGPCAELLLRAVCNAARQDPPASGSSTTIDPAAMTKQLGATHFMLRLLPHIERQDPQCASLIRTRATNLVAGLPEGRVKDNFVASATSKTTEQLLSEASSTQSKSQQDSYYSVALLDAMEKHDWEKAFRIAEMFNNETTRVSNLGFVAYRAALSSLEGKDLDKASGYARRIKSLDEVSQVYSQMANLLREQGHSEAAMEVLRVARAIVEKGDDQERPGDALLQLSGVMARLDSVTAFEMTSSAIELLNRRVRNAKDQPSGGVRNASRSIYSTRLEETMRLLARVSFEDSLRVAKAVENRVAQIQSRIVICREALSNETKK